VFSIAFTPDGQRIASAGNSPVVHVRPTPPRNLVPTDPAAVAAWIASRSTAALASPIAVARDRP
jgi:hypothetical protein